MKKKLLLSFLVLISLFMISGCRRNYNYYGYNYPITEEKDQGRIYELVSLYDYNVLMFNGVVPKGWTASIYTQNLVNSSYPFAETIVLTNPEGTAKITILSQHSYVENNKYNEGQNKEYYTTYLHQMDASTYLDYFMSKIYPGSSLVKEDTVDSNVLSQLKTLHDLKVYQANLDANQLQTQAQTSGVSISVGDEGYSSAKKEYENGETYYEALTSVSAISTNLYSSLSNLLDSRAVTWYMPYVIVYEGSTKEDFDNNYEDYKFIIENSSFTKDYYTMVEYVSSIIVNYYTSIYAERSKAGLQAMNDYIDSNYSSTSAASTQDKVREMWDDVIKEQDKYILEDGSSFKTSIQTETVAQNGNEIYVGTKAGIPIGFNEVSKGY